MGISLGEWAHTTNRRRWWVLTLPIGAPKKTKVDIRDKPPPFLPSKTCFLSIVRARIERLLLRRPTCRTSPANTKNIRTQNLTRTYSRTHTHAYTIIQTTANTRRNAHAHIVYTKAYVHKSVRTHSNTITAVVRLVPLSPARDSPKTVEGNDAGYRYRYRYRFHYSHY